MAPLRKRIENSASKLAKPMLLKELPTTCRAAPRTAGRRLEATSHSDLGGPNLLQLGRMWRILLAVQMSIRGSYKAEDKARTPNSIQFNGVVIDAVVGIRFRLRATCFAP